MSCKKCGKPVPDGALFCPWCGRKLIREQARKQRGNGQGTVYQLESGKYKAVVTLGYYLDENGKRKRKTRTRVCEKKRDAVAAIQELKKSRRRKAKRLSPSSGSMTNGFPPTGPEKIR
jgi:uncharacterized Zn finger protein (UPF0148 family)